MGDRHRPQRRRHRRAPGSVRAGSSGVSADTSQPPTPPSPRRAGNAAVLLGKGSVDVGEWVLDIPGVGTVSPPRAHCSVMSLRREKRECFILMSSSGLSKIHQKQESDLLRFGMAVSTRQRWGHSSGPGGGGGG